MKALKKSYPTNLSNAQWQLLKPLIPPAKPGGRPRSVDIRAILNAIFYLLVSGCPWQMIPGDFPPYKTVYHYFRSLVHRRSLAMPQRPSQTYGTSESRSSS